MRCALGCDQEGSIHLVFFFIFIHHTVQHAIRFVQEFRFPIDAPVTSSLISALSIRAAYLPTNYTHQY